jgi:ATP-grasp ribosomal peptide maturase
MKGRTVLVVTGELDITADYVIMELNRRGVDVMRCDPGDFPQTLSLGARFGSKQWTGRLTDGVRSVELSKVCGAWLRRPSPITVDAVSEAAWATREARAGFHGVLATLPWLSHPEDLRRAEHKPLQLQMADRAGLSVPPTLITNDPAEAARFAAEHGPIIYKPMGLGLLEDGRQIFAGRVDPDFLGDDIASTAHMFQQEIPKKHELRVTIVRDKIFAARIDASTEAGRRDWRSDYTNLTYTQARLPWPVITKLRRFMQLMRIRFAAIDIIVTLDGDYTFLDANPSGQWAWIEDETGLPIAAAIADALEGRRL